MTTTIHGLEGALPAGNVAIVVSRYNEAITGKLRDGAVQTFGNAGIDGERVLVIEAPGAWELPWVSEQALARQDVMAAVALGAVIRGETTHDQHINRAVSMALMDLGLKYNKPVAFGLLTCNTVEQAIHRSGGNVGNKGEESTAAVLELLRLQAKLKKGDGG